MQEITLKKVRDHAQAVDKYCAAHGGTRVLTALFGSQNYKLDNENSDVDTKSLIIPELTNWLWNAKDVANNIITMPDGSHAEMKSVVSMFKQFVKGNINFIEILYTPYVDVAPGWERLYEELTFSADYITEHDKYNQASVWFGFLNQMIQRTQQQPSTAHYNSLGYNPKALMNALRLKETIIRYFKFNYPFEKAIDMTDSREYLLSIKAGVLTQHQAFDILNDLKLWMAEMKTWICEHYENKKTFNAEFYLQQIAFEIFIKMNEMNQ